MVHLAVLHYEGRHLLWLVRVTCFAHLLWLARLLCTCLSVVKNTCRSNTFLKSLSFCDLVIGSVAIVDADNQVSIFLRWLKRLVNLTTGRSCDVALTIYNGKNFLGFLRLPVYGIVTSCVLNLCLVDDNRLTRSTHLLTFQFFELQLLKIILHLRFKLRLLWTCSLHWNLLRFEYMPYLSLHDILRHHARIYLLALFYLILQYMYLQFMLITIHIPGDPRKCP